MCSSILSHQSAVPGAHPDDEHDGDGDRDALRRRPVAPGPALRSARQQPDRDRHRDAHQRSRRAVSDASAVGRHHGHRRRRGRAGCAKRHAGNAGDRRTRLAAARRPHVHRRRVGRRDASAVQHVSRHDNRAASTRFAVHGGYRFATGEPANRNLLFDIGTGYGQTGDRSSARRPTCCSEATCRRPSSRRTRRSSARSDVARVPKPASLLYRSRSAIPGTYSAGNVLSLSVIPRWRFAGYFVLERQVHAHEHRRRQVRAGHDRGEQSRHSATPRPRRKHSVWASHIRRPASPILRRDACRSRCRSAISRRSPERAGRYRRRFGIR